MENRSIIFSFGSNNHYRATQLLLRRKHKGTQEQTLVKWSRICSTVKGEKGASGRETTREKSMNKEVLMWMRREEIQACCPHLVESIPTQESERSEETVANQEDRSLAPAGGVEENDSLHEMAVEVANLVSRAKRITQRISRKSSQSLEKLLADTVNILSAYAKLGSLANSFRECGALDLLLDLLSFQLPNIRKSASDMLRALSAYDSASRAYVLLHLANREGPENGDTPTLENRQMLLELFAETSSQDEENVGLANISLPQVPGRFVYSLLKRYLRVTSLSNSSEHGQQSGFPSVSAHSSSSSRLLSSVADSLPDKFAVAEEFDYFSNLFQLLSELFAVFSWTEHQVKQTVGEDPLFKVRGLSIFTGNASSSALSLARQKKMFTYKTRGDFGSSSEYGQYVKSILTPGMRVRARVSYESVVEGDIGEYCQTNDGSPPAQFTWEGLGGDTYWVFWHQVEVLPVEQSEEEHKSKAIALSRPIRQPYTLCSAHQSTLASNVDHDHLVPRPHWWEVVCMIKTLPQSQLEEVAVILGQPELKSVTQLLSFTPSYQQAAEVLVHLESCCPHLSLEPLTLHQENLFQETYKLLSSAGVKEEDEVKDKSDEENLRPSPPYPDPYDIDEPLTSIMPFQPEGSMDSSILFIHSLIQRSIDHQPLSSLITAEELLSSSEFSLQELAKQREIINKHIEKYSESCKVVVHSLKVLKAAIDKLVDESDRIECCVSGLFRLILKLMHKQIKSVTAQNLGLNCFFSLMGGGAVTGRFPLPSSELRPILLSSSTRSTIMAIIYSLVSVTECGGLKTIVDGLGCIADNYNLEMTSKQKKECLAAVRNGLCIVVTLLSQGELCDASKLLAQWGMVEVIGKIRKHLPDFPVKYELCSCVISKMNSAGDQSMESLSEEGAESAREEERENDTNNSFSGGIEKEVISAVRSLEHYSCRNDRNPIPRLLKLVSRELYVGDDTFVCPSPEFTKTFLCHYGVLHLAEAIEGNKSSSFVEGALLLLGSLSLAGVEEAATVVLQGGLKAAIAAVSRSQTKLAVLLFCKLLTQLLLDPDVQVVVVAENVAAVLKACREKFGHDIEVSAAIQKVLDLLVEADRGMCELKKMATQNSRILGIIFMGVLQLLLTEVEEARRSHALPCIPRLACLIQFISSGGGVTMSEREKCFEKLEVSSSTYRKSRLTDGDSTTYWESGGRSGSHWIRLHMKKGVVIRKLAIEVNSSDSSYMPQTVVVLGGDTSDSCTEINTVSIPSSHTGSYDVLSNARVHYPVIMIKIKRCQQGGIDTRVRGLICEGGRSSLWPLFGDLFTLRTQLFYTILAHTWARNSTGDPLELFDRVSAAVSHEQAFADSYFHTEESRQSLGQACREALFNPLVVALTDRNASGVTLSILLHRYLSHVQPPLSFSSPLLFLLSSELQTTPTIPRADPASDPTMSTRLVEMSRTRRMCRLLVDCNGNTTSHSPMKNDHQRLGKDGASAVTIATCWQEIITTEVLACLRKCDSSEPPLLVMVELLMMYSKLRQATIELFGGHSQFALALKEGFSKAFQGLNEVEGVQLCELLCLSIDVLMDAARKDNSRLQQLSESTREELLLRLAEPLQFLHNLDIANIFEHFYRRHLSSRLLRNRSVSLTTEKHLAHALTYCFPNKYPLQMLMDLDESHNLIERFRQSDQLEKLDQLLHSWQTQGAQMPVPEKALQLAQKSVFYQRHDLEVFVLTPCYWQLKHRPLAPSSLPAPLDSFLSDYETYFATVFRGAHQSHEKARQLHWTLYGGATVVHRDIRIMVSTTQVLVLLQFNGSEELSYKTLLESTLLPVHELTDALLSLTTERQSLLSSIPPSSSGHGHELTSKSLLEEESFAAPFLPETLFYVSNSFVDGLVAGGVTELRIHGVKLLSHLPANRLGRSVDLAHVFERRRAIIDASIVRILKREKETSVDSVAVKVIKGCSVGHFEGKASFGRFLCGFKDVCSRVECLVVKGYIKRDQDHPQMLIYVPDPTEGTQSATASLGSDHEMKTLPKEEGHLESRESQNVGPAQQQEQQQTQTQTKLSDPKTHDTLPPLASSLSLSRKRPGSSTSPLTSAKRKQHVLDRMYSSESSEHEEVPLMNLGTSGLSLSLDEVEARIQEDIASLAAVLRVREDVVESLLYQSGWKKDVLIQKYLADSNTALQQCGLASPSAATICPIPAEDMSCPVCLLCVSRDESVSLWCGHACCKHCWQEYLHMQIASLNRALLCTCPVNGCQARPTRTFITSLLQPGSKVIQKYNKAVVRSYVEGSGWLTWCRNPQGCDQVLCWGDGVDSGTCSKCKWSSCFSCTYTEAHQPASCAYVTKWIEAGGFYEGMDEDAKSKQLANVISKRCPGCNAQIEKNEGCLRMICKCGHDFCWRCQKPWRPTHTDYFNCSAKVSKAARDAKKFVDYNQRCASYHRSKLFSHKLCLLVKGIGEPVPMSTLTFLMDACELLVQCHKMLFYCCIMEYYTPPDSFDYLTVLSDDLEAGTSALQAFLENTLLASVDTSHSIRTLPDRKLHDGYRLVNKIEATREKLLIGSKQHFKLGESPSTSKTTSKEQDDSKSEPKESAANSSNLGPERPFSYMHNLNTEENNPFGENGDDDDDDDEDDDEDDDDDEDPYSPCYLHSDYDDDYYYNSYDEDEYSGFMFD